MSAESSEHTDRAVDYVELGSTDLEATRRFYEAAFGWEFNAYGPAYLGYHDGPKAERPREAGGFRLEAAVVRGSTLVVLYARDLGAARARVAQAGGSITKETFEFPGGRRFHFSDPSGNELGVWSER